MSLATRIKASAILAAAATVIFFSLSTHTVQAQTPAPPKFTSAHIGSIEVFLVEDDAPDEKRLEDKKSLESRAPAIIKKSLQSEGLQIVEDGAQQTATGLVSIRTTVKYNPGNRALRWVSGPFLGKGKGKIDVHMEAINPATSQVITVIDVQDTTGRFSMTGGDFYKIADGALEDAAADLASKILELQ